MYEFRDFEKIKSEMTAKIKQEIMEEMRYEI